MCTATWQFGPEGYELYFNRDERRTRGPALPPDFRSTGAVRFVAPVDGDFGGTWIAANEHGVSLCLLNGYSAKDGEPPPAESWVSRGLLLTSLADARSTRQIERRLERRSLDRYRSFDLAAFAPGGDTMLARWLGERLSVDHDLPSESPLISSSFDGGKVRETRAAVFRDLRARPDSSPRRNHLDYHSSHLPSRSPYSPCMHRDDASTVSFSRIRVDPDRVQFFYAPRSPCRGLPEEPSVTLPRR